MNDEKFDLLRSTANEIAKASTKYETLIDQRRSVVRELDAANAFFDKAFSSKGVLDITVPQRKVIEASSLLDDCEKRILKAKEELIEAVACVEAEGLLK